MISHVALPECRCFCQKGFFEASTHVVDRAVIDIDLFLVVSTLSVCLMNIMENCFVIYSPLVCTLLTCHVLAKTTYHVDFFVSAAVHYFVLPHCIEW